MKNKILFTIFISILLICILTISVNATISGFATSIGSRYNNIDTQYSIVHAADCYNRYGYSQSNSIMDPVYILRLSNMSAKVQFYNEHGNVDVVRGLNSGIKVGNNLTYNGVEYIGTDVFDTWFSAGTVLVTYVACLTAGDGVPDNGSIAYQTALKGANLVVGFKKSIDTNSLGEWATHYNNRLGWGDGVQDAVNYANSFTYDDPRVKSNHLVYHTDPNLDISGNKVKSKSIQENEKNLIDDRNILTKINERLSLDKSNYSNAISKVNKEFDINNYEVVSREESTSENIITGEIQSKEYIDLKLKIGDFTTNAGYVVELENDKVKAIYDNNIDISKQKAILKSADNFNFSNSKKSIADRTNYIENAKKQVIDNFKDFDVKIVDTSEDYYYDIKSEKKYFVVTVSSELIKDSITTLSKDRIYFEID